MALDGYLARILPALLNARLVRKHRQLVWNEVVRLSEGVRRLSAGFTGTRVLPGSRYLADRELFDAYLLFYFPVTYAKVAQVLATLPEVRPDGCALDLGSGPGPGSLALGHLIGPDALVVAADREKSALGALRTVWGYAGVGRLKTVPWEAPATIPPAPEAFDVILAANLLNELFVAHPRRERLIAKWLWTLCCERLVGGGSLVLLEPALRETSRSLLRVRDLLVERGMWVRGPCVVQDSCPAVTRERDWCHAAQPWEPPEWVRAIGDEAGISTRSMGFSYVVLTLDQVHQVEEGMARVVSDALVEAGKRKFWVCGTMGRKLVSRLDKHASPKNFDFDKVVRGDLVVLDGLRIAGDEVRLDADSDVLLADRSEPRDLPGSRVDVFVRRPD